MESRAFELARSLSVSAKCWRACLVNDHRTHPVPIGLCLDNWRDARDFFRVRAALPAGLRVRVCHVRPVHLIGQAVRLLKASVGVLTRVSYGDPAPWTAPNLTCDPGNFTC